jgi:hypothetical protein
MPPTIAVVERAVLLSAASAPIESDDVENVFAVAALVHPFAGLPAAELLLQVQEKRLAVGESRSLPLVLRS